MATRKTGRVLTILLPLALLLFSCGGGGSTSSVTGQATALTVVEKVSVVDAQAGGGAQPASAAPARRAGPRPLALPTDPNSDYVKDKANVYVEERSVESFNLVNEILCMMSQTRYGAMLNMGPYKAQVDMKACKGKDSVSAGGQQSANQSSGANMPEYEMWTVDSSRVDGSSPHIVKVWLHEAAQDMEPEKLIYVNVSITEGVSASNPLGIFTLNFEGHPSPGGVPGPQVMFRGVLKAERDAITGKVLLKFFNDGGFSIPGEGNVSFTEKVLLDRNADGSGGTGTLFNQESSPGGSKTTAFDIAFNGNNFLRDDGTSSVCLDRKNFDSSAWRYGLYDESGARVNRNSGFPVLLTRSGTDYHGWIGYWGPWFPNNLALLDGETVTKQTYGNGGGTPEQFTAMVRGGKLKKHTRRILTLGDVVNVPLDYHEFDQATGIDNQFRVIWDGANFKKTAVMDKSNWTWTNISPVLFDLNNLKYSELFFWSQSQGGSVQVKLQGCTPDNKGTPDPSDDTFACSAGNGTPVVSYAEVTVSPSDTIPVTLACFENCPDSAKVVASNPYPFVDNLSGYQPVPPTDPSLVYKAYTFSGMILKDGGNDLIATDNIYNWGLMSGPLFEPSASNLNMLQCEFDNNATCGWQARSNLPVFYTWETGPNSWNKFTALQSVPAGTFVSFDPPLSAEYVHTGNGYTNAKFYLEYNGFGDLHGIPGKCVDMDTGLDADCSQGGPGSFIRWVPEFTIPDGSVATSGATSYYVKALELEQRMKAVAGSVCTSAGLTTTSYASQLPTLSDWTAPGNGAEPVVSGAPAVVGGVLQ